MIAALFFFSALLLLLALVLFFHIHMEGIINIVKQSVAIVLLFINLYIKCFITQPDLI